MNSTAEAVAQAALSPWRRRQVAMLYHYTSLEYLEDISGMISRLISGLLTPDQEKSREMLEEMHALLKVDIKQRSAGRYVWGSLDHFFNQVAHADIYEDSHRRSDEYQIYSGLISGYIAPTDSLLIGHRRQRPVGDHWFASHYADFLSDCARIPKFRVRLDIFAETGQRPPRPGVYVCLDDPNAAPQFAWPDHDRGELTECCTFSDIALNALVMIGRDALWFDQNKMNEFVGAPARKAIFDNLTTGSPSLAASALARVGNVRRPATWHFVEIEEPDFEDSALEWHRNPISRPDQGILAAGDICKVEGSYYAITRPGSDQYLHAGDVAPHIERQPNRTIWQRRVAAVVATTPPLVPNRVMLPSAVERQQIFYWLQKLSSVTAWRRIVQYYKTWADTAELSLRIASERGWDDRTSLPESEYQRISDGLTRCATAIDRLGKGDRDVFSLKKYEDLALALNTLSISSETILRVEMGENGIDEMHTPCWAEFRRALTALSQSWFECADQIYAPYHTTRIGPTSYGLWLQTALKDMSFPDALEAVPSPSDNIFVRTGHHIPCSGIWEPIDAPKPSMLSWLTGRPTPQPPFKIVGAMNYLHGGSAAPQIRVASECDSHCLDTTWRLLWRDERYQGGTVPENETSYRFHQPKVPPTLSQAHWAMRQTLYAESGMAAPAAGIWIADCRTSARVTVQKGETLPLHGGREVSWARETY
jgi:hypothetical protein